MSRAPLFPRFVYRPRHMIHYDTKLSGTVPGAASPIESQWIPEITVIVHDDRELRGLQVHYL